MFLNDKICHFRVQSVFAGGSGTKADPYQIETKEQLNAVRDNMSACYILTKDIVFEDPDFAEGGIFYNNGQGWKPIGRFNALTGYVDYGSCYSGVFDGNGHKIVNLKQNITTKDSDYLTQGSGRFDCNTSGEIVVNTDGFAGGVVGYNEGLVAKCTNAANVSVLYPTERDRYTMAGGIVASNPGEIVCCKNQGDIKIVNTSDGYAGGIAGGGQETYYCMNEGTVESPVFAAGITAMGCNFKGYSCYNKGTVKGKYAGGIVAEVDCSYADQCYNTGDISGDLAGGLAAKTSSGTLDRIVSTNSYYLNTVQNGLAEEEEWDGMTSFAISAISSKETFVGFDFDNIWNMSENGPELKNTVFDYYKEHDKMYDYNKGKDYQGLFNESWLKTDYYVGDDIDLAGAMFTGRNIVAIVKGNEELIESQIDYYTLDYDADPVYLDDDTIYFVNEDGTKYYYILLVDPDELEVSGFDTSEPTTKSQKVTLQYYRFTGTYKINVSERPHVHAADDGTVAIPADCVNPGEVVYKCKDCGEVMRTENVPALGHNLVKTAAIPATTTENGNTEYYTCSVCNKYFSDALGQNEIQKGSWIIPVVQESTKAPSFDATEEKTYIQNITFRKCKQYKAKNLKKKKVEFSLKAKTTGDGKLTYKVTKGSKKCITVSKSGKVTLKKGCRKGVYKIIITASKTEKYEKATKLVTIKVR